MNNVLPVLVPFAHDNDFNTLTHRWKKWLESFEDVLTILDDTNITDEDHQPDPIKVSKRKRALLKHYVGEETKDILATLPDTGATYEDAIKALNIHFGSQKNIDYEVYLFRQIKQLNDESLDQYLTRLKKAASTCEFIEEARELKSQIVLGGKSTKLRRYVLQTPGLTLTDLLKYGRANETAERHASAIEQITAGTTNVMNIRQTTKPTQRIAVEEADRSTSKKTSRGKHCQFCGELWHDKGLSMCRAQGKTCNFCKKPNHFSSVCKKRRAVSSEQGNRNETHLSRKPENFRRDTTNHLTHQKQDINSDDDYVLANYNDNTKKHDYVTAKLTINNVQLNPIIDTGATLNILSMRDFHKLHPRPSLTRPSSRTYSFGSQIPLKIEGIASLGVEHRNKKHQLAFHVTSELGPSLIGKDTAIQLGVIKFINNIQNATERAEITNMQAEFQDLFQGMGKHKTTTIKLLIDQTITPIIQRHRRIPFHVRKMVEKELEELLREDIIEPVPESEPTTWLSPIVIRPKKDDPNRIRLCVDMKAANTAIMRERHLTPTIDDVIYDLNNTKLFSKLDLNKGYHQLELDPDSRSITTFSTHVGMFRYKRLSFGINSAAETFQREIHKTIQGIPGVMNVSDDILIYGKTISEHDLALRATLTRLRTAGLTLNKSKCRFSRTKLRFLGHIFSDQGMQPDPDKIRSIQEVTPPNNPTEIRSFLGMTNFCTKYIPGLAILTHPLRKLTRKTEPWRWTEVEGKAFEDTKTQMAKATSLKYFDRTKNTELWVDAGPKGLGAILSQQTPAGPHSIIAFASHSLTDTELRYSQIEKEALAITWAIQHFHLYVFGHPFQVITDHKPLLPLFNNYNQSLSTRLERWKFKLQPYQFEVIYRPGRENPADYLSRHSLTKPTASTQQSDQLTENYVNFIINTTIPKTLTLQDIKEHTRKDPIIQQVMTNIRTTNWGGHSRNNQMKAYNQIRMELSTDKECSVLLRGTRLVIPSGLQRRIIDLAHSCHQGISKTKAILREKAWFPGLDNFVEKVVRNCRQCQAATEMHQRPELCPSETPSGPWQELNLDHKGPLPNGEYLLVIVDQFSKFPVVEIVPSTATKPNIEALDRVLATFGIPKAIHSDNGAPFNSRDFAAYLSSLGVTQKKITPRWPRANGSVERFNQTLSKILKIAHEFRQDWKKEMNNLLRDYRTTAHATTKVTPAELLFNYQPANRLPDARNLSNPSDDSALRKRIDVNQQAMKHYHDSRYSINRQSIQPGDLVLVKQPQTHKMKTHYDPDPYEVTSINSSMITAERRGKKITRNSSFYKVIPNDECRNHEADEELASRENINAPLEKEGIMTGSGEPLPSQQKEIQQKEMDIETHQQTGESPASGDNINYSPPDRSSFEAPGSNETALGRYNLRTHINRTKRLIEEYSPLRKRK